MMSCSSIVLIAPSRVYPPLAGGHQRTLATAQGLARAGYKVTVLCLAGRKPDYVHREGEKSYCFQELEERLVQIVDLGLRQGLAQSLMRHLGYSKLWSYLLWPLLKKSKVCKETLEQADIFILDSPFIASSTLPKKPLIVLSHNLEAELCLAGDFVERTFLLPLVKRVEQSTAEKASAVLSCAPSDTQFYEAINPKVVELANGMQKQTTSLEQDNKSRELLGFDEDLLLLFVGSRYEPNRIAAERLRSYTEQREAFLSKHRIRFVIAGSVFAESFSSEVLTITGPVEDMKPYLSCADLAINAVTTGSGSNVKNFEALAAGLPVLSTRFGARGLDEQLANTLSYFSSFEDIDHHLENLVGQREFLKRKGTELLQQYSQHILMDQMVERNAVPLIESLIEKDSLRSSL